VLKEYVCQSFCFGYKNRRWKVGTSVFVDEVEAKNLPKWFVPKEQYVIPEVGLAGGPRIDGVLKAPVKITDTAMSPDTRRMLGLDKTETQEETGDPHKIDFLVSSSEPEKENIQKPMKRGRRLGSKN
jgi:hypothetical protein